MSEILQKIENAKHVVVIAHVNPDADSIGSASALYTHVLRLHKKVSFFCATKNINQKFAFLPWFDKIRDSFPSSADLAVSLDCGTKSRLGIEIECDLINIDHHSSNTGYGELALVDTECISTSEVLYNLFKKNSVTINAKMATALYAGLLDDSKGFMDERVDGTTFALIQELIKSGAEYKVCNRFLRQYLSLGAFRLKAIMYQNMILCNEARVALFCVSNDDMKASGAVKEDCQSVLDEALYLPSVELSLLLKENSDLSVKGSLRSCTNIDVSKIASQFGGGGHVHRAGFNIQENLKDAKSIVMKLIEKEI